VPKAPKKKKKEKEKKGNATNESFDTSVVLKELFSVNSHFNVVIDS
jgi:hypothetical protein